MTPNAAPQHFTTVLSGDQSVIHVGMVEHISPLQLGEQHTLCGEPVVCQVSAQAFHRLGCPSCATEAVRAGVVSIADRRQATVNLPRFLAARQARDDTSAPGTVPGQRDSVEH